MQQEPRTIGGTDSIYVWPIFAGLCKGVSQQNIAKNMVQYLHFRILKFPLIMSLCMYLSISKQLDFLIPTPKKSKQTMKSMFQLSVVEKHQTGKEKQHAHLLLWATQRGFQEKTIQSLHGSVSDFVVIVLLKLHVWSCILLHYIILYHIISYYIILYHIISYCIILYHIISYYIILYHIISYYIYI